MSQFDFPVIDPLVTTGTELADYLNSWVPAAESQHAGAARPSYATAGMLWVQQVSSTDWKLNLYTGSVDIPIVSLNPTTGTLSAITYAGLTVASGTLTASAPGISLTQTWNNAAVDFVGADTNITNTASGAGSLVERWRIGGVEKMSLSKLSVLKLTGTGAAVQTSDGTVTAFSGYVTAAVAQFGTYSNHTVQFLVNNIARAAITDTAFSTSVPWMTFLGNSASTSPPASATSGLSIGWNKTSGGGEVDFYGNGAGGSIGGFAFYDWNGTTATEMARFRSTGLRLSRAGQLFLWFDKTSTGKIWRLQTDIAVTDDFGIFNETTNGAALSIAPGAGGAVTVHNRTFKAGNIMQLNQGIPPPGVGEGNIGGTGGDGLTLIGNGGTTDILLYNKSGTVAAYIPTGTSNWYINGALAKGSGTFDIVHPLDATKRLRHSFIEGPRYDLIYRGRVTVAGGTATVDLDAQCGGTGMSAGTFIALTRNPDAWLNRGDCSATITGATLTITGTDGPVSWLVIAERKDAHILENASGWNDAGGNMMLEYTPSAPMNELLAGKKRLAPAPIN